MIRPGIELRSPRPLANTLTIMPRDKYIDLVKEQRKQWYMRMTELPNVIGALGTIPKSLERGLEDLDIGV